MSMSKFASKDDYYLSKIKKLQAEVKALKAENSNKDDDFDGMQTRMMDRIAELEKDNIELKEAQRWRKVEEELPDDRQEVWVKSNDLNRCVICNFVKFTGVHHFYHDNGGGEDYWDLDVTHWMPLLKFKEK